MKEVPILLSEAEVRGLLREIKTQARKVIKPQPSAYAMMPKNWFSVMKQRAEPDIYGGDGLTWGNVPMADGSWGGVRCPYQPGMRLWVQETWGDVDIYYQSYTNDFPGVVAYGADFSAIQWDAPSPRRIPRHDIEQWNWDKMRWRPPTSMPRGASRIDLELMKVRVERVWDITEEDAIAEGLQDWYGPEPYGPAYSSRIRFFNFWDSINGGKPGCSLDDNPWVWVLEFEKVK